MAEPKRGGRKREVVVRCPSEPSELPPEASRALVALLMAVAEEQRRNKPPRDQ